MLFAKKPALAKKRCRKPLHDPGWERHLATAQRLAADKIEDLVNDARRQHPNAVAFTVTNLEINLSWEVKLQ